MTDTQTENQNIQMTIEPRNNNENQNIQMTIEPTTSERTNTQIENLRDKIIKLCEKMYDLKKLNEDESKINQTLVNDMCDYPDYIELYKRHPKFSTQYLKNINAVIKLTNTKEEFYEYITDNQYGIYKLLYILSKIDTVSTKKSYVCAVKHLMVQVIPNSEANCKVLETEIADLIFRNNRITRNKKNSEIKSSSIEHHRFLIQQLKTEFFCIYGTLEKNT